MLKVDGIIPQRTITTFERMKPYEKYKDSGVEWIGEIPEHWVVSKIRYCSTSVKTGKTPPTENESYFEEGQINWFGPGDFKTLFLRDSSRTITEKAVNELKLELYPEGTVLLIGIGATLGKVGIINAPSYSNQQVNAIIFNSYINPQYGLFFLDVFKEITANEASSSTMAILNQSKTKDLLLLKPTLQEQTAIAKYLDHQTAIIDELIEKKTKQIALLKEKRQAIINETVTKGLDPTAKMKDSGVDGGDHRWLGEIPESWEITPLKHLATLKGRLGWKGLKADEYVPEGFGFLSTPDIKGDTIDFNSINYITEERYLESPEIMLEVGDVLLVKDGSTLGITNIIKELPIPSTVNSSIAVIRINDTKKLLPEYLLALLSSNALQTVVNKLKAGQGVPHLFQKDIKNFLILIPALGEQKKIIEYIDGLKEKVNTIIRRSELQIEKLKEYRQSLISEAVTGKIDVRGWVATIQPKL